MATKLKVVLFYGNPLVVISEVVEIPVKYTVKVMSLKVFANLDIYSL